MFRVITNKHMVRFVPLMTNRSVKLHACEDNTLSGLYLWWQIEASSYTLVKTTHGPVCTSDDKSKRQATRLWRQHMVRFVHLMKNRSVKLHACEDNTWSGLYIWWQIEASSYTLVNTTHGPVCTSDDKSKRQVTRLWIQHMVRFVHLMTNRSVKLHACEYNTWSGLYIWWQIEASSYTLVNTTHGPVCTSDDKSKRQVTRLWNMTKRTPSRLGYHKVQSSFRCYSTSTRWIFRTQRQRNTSVLTTSPAWNPD